ATRWSDRDDLVLFFTGDGVVAASKSGLGLDVSKGAVASRVDVSQLPRDAVSAFLRHAVKREPVAEDLSIKSVACLAYLAEFYGNDHLLKQINESLLKAAVKDVRALCFCYIIAHTCSLHVKEQLVKRIATRFEQMIHTMKEFVEQPEMLTPIFERCDLAIENEKSLVFFIVDWTSLHKATREQCAELLNCVRRTFLSREDLDALNSYMKKFGTSEVQSAWKSYLLDTHLTVCWDTKHIMKKLPRCGMGEYKPPTSKSKPNRQNKSIRWSDPLETRAPSEGPSMKGSAMAIQHPLPRKSLLARKPRATNLVKTAFNKGLSKLRQKFTANSQK
ncbi:hypothetical protein V3C99_003748, partial [Haemonchus contortus]